MPSPSLDTERLYYVDWIRVLAFGLLIFFHCAMPFVEIPWEVRNNEHSVMLTRLIRWLHQWRLPLLFFIAGVGTHFSLARRSGISFLGERVVRLFIPLLFAMLFTIPFQVYYEYLQKGRIAMSYVEFYPSVWQFVAYPDGSLTWSHLWFVVYLFVFTLLLLPVFLIMKIQVVQAYKLKLDGLFKSPLAIVALAAVLVFLYFELYVDWPAQMGLLDDWFLFFYSMTLFFFGFLLANLPSFWNTCEKYRWYFLTLAAVCIIWLFISYWWNFDFPKKQDERLYIFGILNSLHVWMIILSVLGFAKRHLNFSNAFLRYTTPAVYPYYILHQTIIVISGYYVVQWPLPILVKLLILVILCFGSVTLIYHFFIRHFMLTRILYGLKARKR